MRYAIFENNLWKCRIMSTLVFLSNSWALKEPAQWIFSHLHILPSLNHTFSYLQRTIFISYYSTPYPFQQRLWIRDKTSQISSMRYRLTTNELQISVLPQGGANLPPTLNRSGSDWDRDHLRDLKVVHLDNLPISRFFASSSRSF